MVTLALDSDDACTSLNGHYARKCAVLVLIYATKQQVIGNKMCEGTDCSGMTSLQVMVASAKSVGWGSNEGVTLLYLVPCPSAHMYSMQTQGSETFLINAPDQNLHWHSI